MCKIKGKADKDLINDTERNVLLMCRIQKKLLKHIFKGNGYSWMVLPQLFQGRQHL